MNSTWNKIVGDVGLFFRSYEEKCLCASSIAKHKSELNLCIHA